MTAVPKNVPSGMTVEDFLAWPGDGTGRPFQLVNGEPRAMAPAGLVHGALQMNIGLLLEGHLRAKSSPCRAIGAPGVIPRVRAHANVRIPDVAVTCSPLDANPRTMLDPILVVEILSPSNAPETWENDWAYTTIPSVREILVLHSVRIAAELLRRQPDGSWPERPEIVTEDDALSLASVEFSCPLVEVYVRTGLERTRPT